MSERNKTRHSQGWLVWFIPVLLAEFAWFIGLLLNGKNVAILNPKGLIAQEQFSLLILITIVLLVATVPTIFVLYFIAWKYRESNTKATHDPDSRNGKRFVFSIWAIPTVFLLILTPIMLASTHRLEPRDTIASDAKPITIQVVSMRWKWVFLYPDQKIATVNFVQIPENTPVIFELTADEAPMSSFWIPNLGGQLYSMTGHVNRLNLLAEKTGDYPGSSAEINGAGFSGMKFTARVSSAADFELWTESVRQSSSVLDNATYGNLVKPSENTPVALYSSYESDIYDSVVKKYTGSHHHEPAKYEAHH